MKRVIAGVLIVLAAPGVAEAKKKKPKQAPTVSVMSRNLYLGADLTNAFRATDVCTAVDAGGVILDEVDASNFPARSKLLAAEINKAKPDVVGLQEAALWRFQADADFTGSPATEVRYDFLQTLLDDLGGTYSVAVVQDEFDQELPADRDGDDATQDAGFALCGADEDGRLTMRDAILLRKGSKVKLSKPTKGQFENLLALKLGGAIDVKVARGWVAAQAKIAKTKKTKAASLKLVNAHLESFGDPALREAQAKELIAGPLKTSGQLIALGDFNSGGPKDRVGAGFTTEGDDLAYKALTAAGLIKYGARQTCCFPGVLASAFDGYQLDHTVDHIFAKPKVKQVRSSVTGADPTVVSPEGLVASDHGGLLGVFKLG